MSRNNICINCGRTLSNKITIFRSMLKKKLKRDKKNGTKTAEDNRDIFKALNIKDECCKMFVISSIEDY
jgi:DNA-directed RNA polymerase subunit N (RpoN/RPB10)